MRNILLALLATLPMLQPAWAEETASAPQVGETRIFNDWAVGCGNLRACTAIGMVRQGAEDIAYVKVDRGGGASAVPAVSVVVLAEGDEQEASLDLSLEGKDTALPFDRLRASGADSYLRALVGANETGAFVGALLNGETLDLRKNGKGEPARVSLRGMSAALRYMDAEQGRDGGVTALVAKGDEPAEAVPAPVAPVPQRALTLTGLDPVPPLPKGIPVPGEDCAQGAGPEAYEAANGLRIFGICRYSAAYNAGVEYWLSDGKGVRRLSFRYGQEAGPSDFDGLVNAGLDEHGVTLTDFDKARGIGDCGTTSSWSFDGKAFQLVGLAGMGECRGVSASDWPVLYTRPVQP